MRSHVSIVLVSFLVIASGAAAADLTLGTGGRVSVEVINADATFRNTLSITNANAAIVSTGCNLEPATGLAGLHLLSEKTSQHGCRVELDADSTTAGVQPFAAGATLNFRMCAQTDADADCEYVWSSNPAQNGGEEHLTTTALFPVEFPGGIFRLAWEDKPLASSDNDFTDLIVVVRVATDTDGDGLWDDWEMFGIDTDGNGTIDLDLPNLLPVDLNADGDTSDPGERTSATRKDLFVEIDSMDCAVAGGDCAAGDAHTHRPRDAAVRAVTAAFDARGVTIHIDNDDAIAHQNFLAIPNACFTAPVGSQFDAVKAASFDAARRYVFHYAVFSHRQTSGSTSSGCGELPGNDFQVSFGSWNYFCAGGTNGGDFCMSDAGCPGSTCQASGDLDGDGAADQDVGTVSQQAGTLMHELGHNLGLHHGGGNWLNFKPNYLSVMNYSFQMGIPPTDPDGGGPMVSRIDYSPSVLATLAENSLSEPAGIGDGTDTTSYDCGGVTQTSAGNAAIDWNCDGDAADTALSTDINGDATVSCVREGANGVRNTIAAGDDVVTGQRIFEGANRQCDTTAAGDDVQWRPTGPLTGFDDWSNLVLAFQSTSDFEDGVHTPLIQFEELDAPLYLAVIAPELGVTMSAAPATVLTGSNVTYSIVVSNSRPAAAADVVLAVALPSSTSYVSCASTGGGVCGGTGNARTVTFGQIPGGGSATVTLVAAVACTLADGAQITTSAAVSSATPDNDPSNDVASATVVSSNPPPVISGASVAPSVLWPPNGKLRTVLVSYAVTDNCDAPGAITRTLSVASSEPADAIGDGSTAPDWTVLDANRVMLRAERSGTGAGRTYTITITATDSGGYSSSKQVSVFVPHAQ
ncbi:MAG TPA: hypothetical protein VGE86_11550 [Thermoanaerobaculia bacterium]